MRQEEPERAAERSAGAHNGDPDRPHYSNVIFSRWIGTAFQAVLQPAAATG